MRNVKTCEFSLLRIGFVVYTDIVDDPFVKGTVILKFKRAKGIRDALKSVLNGMSVVVKRIDAPLVALTVMRGVNYSVYRGVAHIDVGGRHIDLGAERTRAVGELTVLHSLEKVKVLLHRSVAVGAFLTRLCKRSSVFLHLVGREVANVRLSVLDELYRVLIALVKVVRAVEDSA